MHRASARSPDNTRWRPRSFRASTLAVCLALTAAAFVVLVSASAAPNPGTSPTRTPPAGETTTPGRAAATTTAGRSAATLTRSTTGVPVFGGYPDASTTGARGTLTEARATTITQDGTVLTGLDISGTVSIDADDVVLRNVRVTSSSWYAVVVRGRNALIEDSTLVGDFDGVASIAAENGGHYVARRINAYGAPVGVWLSNNSKLYDSYVHDLAHRPGAHNDSVLADGFTGWEVAHNTILNDLDQTSCIWVGMDGHPSQGVVRGNLIAGGGYPVYGGPGTGSGIKVVDNAFSTRYFPRSGYWGVSANWQSPGNTWSGNVWADGPQVGAPILP